MPKPTLADTCAKLDRVLSGSGPMALLAAKDLVRDLVRGVADLGARMEYVERQGELLDRDLRRLEAQRTGDIHGGT